MAKVSSDVFKDTPVSVRVPPRPPPSHLVGGVDALALFADGLELLGCGGADSGDCWEGQEASR